MDGKKTVFDDPFIKGTSTAAAAVVRAVKVNMVASESAMGGVFVLWQWRLARE